MTRPSKEQLYLALTLLIFASVFGFIFKSPILFFAIFSLALLAFLSKSVAKYVSKFLHLVGKTNAMIVLSLIFFLVITPIGFFYRLFGVLKKDNGGWKKSAPVNSFSDPF